MFKQKQSVQKETKVIPPVSNLSCMTSHILSNSFHFVFCIVVKLFNPCRPTLQTYTIVLEETPAELANGFSVDYF